MFHGNICENACENIAAPDKTSLITNCSVVNRHTNVPFLSLIFGEIPVNTVDPGQTALFYPLDLLMYHICSTCI